jgi:FAD/FMN-containing dehydrogenase
MAPKNTVPPVPVLTDSHHSGVSSRLAEGANAAKERVWHNKTTSGVTARHGELPVLPPGIERSRFNTAIDELRRILGPQHVAINDKPLDDGWYLEHPNTHDAFHLLDPNDTVSSAAAYPGSTEEVSSVVKWANEYEIPLWPISMGRNLGYGGAAPRVRGSIVLDLGKRMNQVLNIDGEQCSCLVEPGVSYYRLYEEVQKTGHPLWIDPPDLGGGSVLGNAVDRGVGYTPMGDHFANHCGFEVVLPTGDVIRTGMGALPGPNGSDNPTWQSFQYGYGPYIDGIFTQSNFGIVTKMGLWLMPKTEHLTYMATFPRDDDFEEIIEIIRSLMVNKVLGNVPQLRHVIQELAVSGKNREEFYRGKGQIPREVIREHAKKLACGDCSWVFYGTLYGSTQKQIQETLGIVKKAFGAIQGTRFLFPEDVPADHYLHSRVNVCSGVPEIRELEWLNWKKNGAHLFFSPICPTKKRDARKITDIAIRVHEEFGLDLFPTFCIAPREMHLIVNIVYDKSNPDEKRRSVAAIRKMINECAEAGYGEYRTHILLADQVANTYSWNNQALLRFHENLKDSLDPKGILAPGRNGIWPKRYRGQGWELLGDSRNTSSPKSKL